MAIDFEQKYGVNSGYVQALFESWQQDAGSIDRTWGEVFEQLAPGAGGIPTTATQAPPAALPSSAGTASAAASTAAPTPAAKPAPRPPAKPAAPASADDEVQREPLRGLAGKIVDNMTASLELPTATSVRTLPVKVLDENRRLLNEHMRVRALGKTSYTHLVAFALVRALSERPAVQASFEVVDGKSFKLTSARVNLGLAIDVPTAGGRTLVVPNIKGADLLDFAAFRAAYEDVVQRGRDGKLTAADFQGTTCTLTNPGGFGTEMSVPRLMKGQGLIVATGSIGLPPQAAGMSHASRAQLAIGPVMTMTSTYDHRVIQGAESGLLLKRVEELLLGESGFWEEVFTVMRVPWEPARPAPDAFREEERPEWETRVASLINAYRVRGCHIADLDPLSYHPDRLPSLDPAFYGLTIWDLDREFLAGGMRGKSVMTLREILTVLRESYCRRWTSEFMHIADRVRKHWLRNRIETPTDEGLFDQAHRLRILTRLSQAEKFERFLGLTYVGNKRFSLEGGDTLIPALAELIGRAASNGVEKVVIGMSHRGRLNVLANILGKSYEQIFREFEGVMLPLSSEGSGDVKYHLGQRGLYKTSSGREVEVLLAANPSHLEAVDPVVCGMVRAYQDVTGDTDRSRVLSVLIHGDAAFSGQGVVAETLNMSALPAYDCGGTVHIVVNNQIGFTAGPRDLRSTYYCTDVAKSIQAPVLHANGDYPESVMRAVQVAVDYQREFSRDAVIDMVCYRRHGHNEGDEPAFTQPLLYERIRNHPTVREHYTALLIRREALTAEDADRISDEFEAELKLAVTEAQGATSPELPLEEVLDVTDDDVEDWVTELSPETGVPAAQLVDIVDECNRMPEGHTVHPNLLRQLRRREKMIRGEQGLDWGCAETVAYGTLLREGIPIRLVGQDSGRGTFSHRHAVIRDQTTGADYVPLAQLGAMSERPAGFEVRDSLLSEEAALAFEYGYAVARPEALVLWEAQFGDFANGAQIAIDQFITSGEAKWKQHSGVTLLLPHGFDGQGPEHSSARPERFLALCSAGNITVANCTTSAQFFHLLRRQAHAAKQRPLVVLTPKSLLRDKHAASDVSEFATGRFHELMPDAHGQDPADVRRVILCSGKVYYDLDAYRVEHKLGDVAVARLEQLYPFPAEALRVELARFPEAELIWCQEEPRNMGAWSFVWQRCADQGLAIRYAGRPDNSSPASGSYKRHQAEQAYLVERAMRR